MISIHVSELRDIAERAKALVNEAIDEIIDAIDTKILVGDIHRPTGKKPRKKRTLRIKRNELSAPTLQNPNQTVDGGYLVDKSFEKKIIKKHDEDLPDLDKDNPFYKDEPKKKREKKSE